MKNNSQKNPTLARRNVLKLVPFAAGALIATLLGGCTSTHNTARRTSRRTSRRN